MKVRLDELVAEGRAYNLTKERGEDVTYRQFNLTGEDADGWYERYTTRKGTEYFVPHPDEKKDAELPGVNILVSPSGSSATMYWDGGELPDGDAKDVRKFLDDLERGIFIEA